MKTFLVEAGILLFVMLAVMAIAFRAAWARDTLRFARNMAWAWVALVVVLAGVEVLREGF